MDGKFATLAGAVALAAAPALAGATPPPASESAVPVAATYAELLNPIPNASARLQQADAEAAGQPQLIEAQYYDNGYNAHHHHHHHHNMYRRAWYMAHGYTWYGGRWVRRNYHHHHHHHHHHNYNY